MNDVLIDFQNVSFSYDEEETDKRLVLENIDLKIHKGEFIVILGHNGSGKSTLAKLSNAIYVPTSGKVLVEGMDTSVPENELAIRKKVGVVFQNPDNQIVATIVEEDVAFGPENLGIPPEEIRQRVDEALKTVGMYDYRLHETHRLSGGQKQRVAIAGIIAMRPECIVLDEPTAMLDPQGRIEVFNTVQKLNREYGITVVFITHYMNEAVTADRVIVIDQGGIRKDADPASVFADRKMLAECGLDVPAVSEIAYLLKQKGLDLSETVLTEDDLVEAFRKLADA